VAQGTGGAIRVRDGRTEARATRLVDNIVLSMAAPTPPEKVLAAARVFAREKSAFRADFPS